MDLDLRALLHIARRRWWLVALLALVGGSGGLVFAGLQTPVYSAHATMLVSPGQATTGALDYNSLLTSERLAETYPELITNSTMDERVERALGIDGFDPDAISASPVGNTQLVKVTVEDTRPERAALIANTVVTEFQGYISEQSANRAAIARRGIDGQIAALEGRLEEIDDRVAELESGDDPMSDVVKRELGDLSQERGAITQSLSELNTKAITIESELMAASAYVEPTDLAQAPTDPVRPRMLLLAALGALAGLAIGTGLVLVLEFLDNTVKPELDIQALTGGPMLATVPLVRKLKAGADQLYTLSQPRSSAAETLRLLRTNLEFASAMKPIGSVTVTSPGPGEGKSTTVANLGVVLAQGGKTVVIIDADLRRPTQDQIFDLPRSEGVTTLLTQPERCWREVARAVGPAGLMVIPSGPLPPNPSDLTSSERFRELVEHIAGEVDMVIIDSPPVLSASDALSTATYTDGVMLVCFSHHTKTDALRMASASIQRSGSRLIGVVINRQKGQHGAAYYGAYYGREATIGD